MHIGYNRAVSRRRPTEAYFRSNSFEFGGPPCVALALAAFTAVTLPSLTAWTGTTLLMADSHGAI